MNAKERQQEVVDDYGVIDDPLERFQIIVETAASGEFPERFRKDENLVPGCTSRVWLGAWMEDGEEVNVAIDSEAPALKGIGGLIVRIYSGSSPDEIRELKPSFISQLGIDRQLTPTRQRGLANIRRRLVEIVDELD